MRVAVDPGLRARADWQTLYRDRVHQASAPFERDLRVRWQVAEVVPWTPLNPAPTLDGARMQLKEHVKADGVDAVIGFTIRRERDRPGSAVPFSNVALVSSFPEANDAQNTIPATHVMATMLGGTATGSGFAERGLKVMRALRPFDLKSGLAGMSEREIGRLAGIIAKSDAKSGNTKAAEAAAQMAIGSFFWGDRLFPQAIRSFQAAAELDKADATPRFMLAAAEAASGKLDAAAAALEEMRKANPKDPSAVEGLAWVRMQQGRATDSVALVAEALKMNPKSARSVVLLAGLMVEGPGQREPAVTQLRGLVRGNADLIGTPRAGMIAQTLSGLSGQAAKAFRERGQTGAIASNRLGILLTASGDRDGARKAFEDAARQDPKLMAAQWNLGLLLWADGDRATGESRMKSAQSPAPKTATKS
ncbi:MAG: tetratricopeptide repeat protein [Bryobacteraceae bacterium]|nr:tetratricopeptide repeat protein [Bryobacteraceae bacterium]